MKNILIVFGTRPEAIKLAPVIKDLKNDGKYNVTVCFTGQHKDMVKNILLLFDIHVDYDLKIMKKNQDLYDITSASLLKLKKVLNELKPDLLIVQGDTTTAFTASLAAFYLKIRVAHVEAGLRSYNNFHPFPEEVNRRFISVLADFNFAPTKEAAQNLLTEGAGANKIFVTGNTVIDAVKGIKSEIEKDRHAAGNEIIPANLYDRRYILVTLHRREKFGKELEKTLLVLKDIADKSGYNFVYPVHLNPNVREPVIKILGGSKNIYLLPPLDYVPFIKLMSRCHFIITDSGGIQEEAYVFRKPVLVMREVTERKEAIEAGYAFLSGTNEKKIKKLFSEIDSRLISGYNFFRTKNPFGDGKASRRIVNNINKKLV